MKTLKKTIALLLALAAICSMAACGKSSKTEDFDEEEKWEEQDCENDRTTDDPEEDTDWETVAQPEEEIEENIQTDWYIRIKEAKQKGIVDEIITDIDVLC